MRDNPQKNVLIRAFLMQLRENTAFGGTWSGLGMNSLYIGTNNGSALAAGLSSLYQK